MDGCAMGGPLSIFSEMHMKNTIQHLVKQAWSQGTLTKNSKPDDDQKLFNGFQSWH